MNGGGRDAKNKLSIWNLIEMGSNISDAKPMKGYLWRLLTIYEECVKNDTYIPYLCLWVWYRYFRDWLCRLHWSGERKEVNMACILFMWDNSLTALNSPILLYNFVGHLIENFYYNLTSLRRKYWKSFDKIANLKYQLSDHGVWEPMNQLFIRLCIKSLLMSSPTS